MIRTTLYALRRRAAGTVHPSRCHPDPAELAPNSVAQKLAAHRPGQQDHAACRRYGRGAPTRCSSIPTSPTPICRLDLKSGPARSVATLPPSFWSVAVYDHGGTVIYSTTNRDGIGQSLDIGRVRPGADAAARRAKNRRQRGTADRRGAERRCLRGRPSGAAATGGSRRATRRMLSRLNCHKIKI